MTKEELEALIRSQLKKDYFGNNSNLSLKEMYNRQNNLEFGVNCFMRLAEACGLIEQPQTMNNSLDERFNYYVDILEAEEKMTKSVLGK